jgi:UDP-N-acetylglucosamine 1-carboxyvinyltransferase
MKMHIGLRIADLRETQGLTQADLAKLLKTTQSAIARIESGKQNVSADMLAKLGKALKKNLVTLSPGTMNLEINGGKKLKGSITTSTSKNGAVGLLCASLLNHGKTTLRKVPRIEEVHRLIEVLESIGVRVEWNKSDITITPPKHYDLKRIDRGAAHKTRSIVMFSKHSHSPNLVDANSGAEQFVHTSTDSSTLECISTRPQTSSR